MSRAKTVCLDIRDFLQGPKIIQVPEGYKRVQLNQFSMRWTQPDNEHIGLAVPAGSNFAPQTGQPFSLTEPDGSPTYVIGHAGTFTVPVCPVVPRLVYLKCTGLNAWKNIIAICPVSGQTSPSLGMQGNVYELDSTTFTISIVDPNDRFVYNTSTVVQFTFL